MPVFRLFLVRRIAAAMAIEVGLAEDIATRL
jgi:hypothetical protein